VPFHASYSSRVAKYQFNFCGALKFCMDFVWRGEFKEFKLKTFLAGEMLKIAVKSPVFTNYKVL
jgi:hypothetical protein